MKSRDPLLELSELRKCYGDVCALDGLDLSVDRGQVVGLLGPNGAGKTTALHVLLGLLEPTSGRSSVLGLDPLRHRARVAERVNFSSAYVQLPSNLTVDENLGIFADLYGVRGAAGRIGRLLELFEVAHLRGRLVGALSAGEKTRVNLCKCLLNDPELLLLDEPTASLDPEMADTVRRTLRRIQLERGIGILYTSHNMPEVEEICDHIVFIHRGRVIARGAPAEVLRTFESSSLEQVFIKIVRGGDLVEEPRP